MWAMLKAYPEEMWPFLIDAAARRIDIGVPPTLVNKVYGKDTVYEVAMMRPSNYYGNEDYIRNRRFTLTPVLNGLRCMAIIEDGETYLYATHGIIEGCDHIIKDLNDCRFTDVVFEGEIIYMSDDAATIDDNYKTLTVKQIASMSDEEIRHLKFYIRDILSTDSFKVRRNNVNYTDRRDYLEANFKETKNVKLLPTLFRGVGGRNIIRTFKRAKEAGLRGIYINLDFDTYKFSTTRSWMKLNVMGAADLMIVDYVKNAEKDILNGFVVDYKGSLITVPLGYTNEERKYFWEHREDFLGRIATVSFIVVKERLDGSGFWLPGISFVDLQPVGAPIKYYGKDNEVEYE